MFYTWKSPQIRQSHPPKKVCGWCGIRSWWGGFESCRQDHWRAKKGGKGQSDQRLLSSRLFRCGSSWLPVGTWWRSTWTETNQPGDLLLCNSDDLISSYLDWPRPWKWHLSEATSIVSTNQMKVGKSARWENGQQKLQWELATARNALKFKKQVEGGLCVPEEVTRWSHYWIHRYS